MRFERYSTRTLAMWLEALNRWEWPKAIPDPEGPKVPGRPRRTQVMGQIKSVLAWRMVDQLHRQGFLKDD